MRFTGVFIHHRHRVLPTHCTPARADGLINKTPRNTVQIEAVATTLGFDNHRYFIMTMEVNQTNRTGIALQRYISVHGDSGASNTIHE